MIKKLFQNIYVDLNPTQKYYCRKYYNSLYLGKIVRNTYVDLVKPFVIWRKIRDLNFFEQSFFSQSGADGIIRTIFDKIGTTNKFCVEFGIHLTEGNTLYLKSKGWDCLWMDASGDGEIINKEFITAENINDLFKKYKVPKEFDLLSIDMDGNDYWVWKAIEKYSPRVVVMEYNPTIPPTESKTIKYDPNFCSEHNEKNEMTSYYGASLLALKKLGESKGYKLITCDNMGDNAFFVRSDLIKENFEIKEIEDIYKPPKFGHKNTNGEYIGFPASKKPMINV